MSTMEDNQELLACRAKFTNEVGKTVQLIEAMKTKVDELVEKENRILDPDVKQSVRNQAIAELERLTEKLVAINTELKIDYVDCPHYAIPYLAPEEDTKHRLMFLSGDNPWNFWLIDRNVAVKELLNNLMKKFKSGLLDPVKNPQPAQSVCFFERNKAVRGIIIHIKNEDRVKLVDCDSNMTKIVSRDKLYKIDKDACVVHATAIRCTITEEPDSIDLWRNSDLRDLFCNVLRETTLGVKIVKRVSGSFPMFVVDVELKNEDNDTASLREWILDRLSPELKKIDNSDNDSICDILSEESLSPFYKRLDDKVMCNETITLSNGLKENKTNNFLKTLHSENLSDNVTDLVSESQENNNYSKNKISETSKNFAFSSNTLNKEHVDIDIPPKTKFVLDNRLSCNSKEFCPKSNKPNIPRFNPKSQNTKTIEVLDQSGSTPTPTCEKRPFPPPGLDHAWPYSVVPVQQTTPSWVAGGPSTWCPAKVNVMASEFVPGNTLNQPIKISKRVEIPKEHVALRKSATLMNENENFRVFVTHVENPSEFYIQFLNKNNQYIDKLSEDMLTYYSTYENVEFTSWQEAKTKLGKYSVCRWPSDDRWYRVEVLKWCCEDNLVKVWFVDYGNTDCVPLTCLQPLIKKFATLSIASQACHLAKIHPIIKGQPWSQEAIQFLKSLVKVEPDILYSIKVVQSHQTSDKKKSSLSVILFDENNKSINDMLVENGLAWSRNLMAESALSISSKSYYSMDDASDTQSSNLSNIASSLACSIDDLNDNESSNLSNIANNLACSIDDVNDNESSNLSNIASNLACSIDDVNIGNNLAEQKPNLRLQNCYEFDDFDPMKEAFESVRNNPWLDTDDACVAVSGYSAQDERRICQFYAREGFCFKAACTKEHSMPNKDGVTTDKEATHSAAFSQIKLPQAGEIVRLKITHVFDINIFYAQIEEKRGVSMEDEFEEDAETLTSLVELMNSPKIISQMKGLVVAPGPGELVLAKEPVTKLWHRARVIDGSYDQMHNIFEVMFVDYGSTSTISQKDLRKIENRFLHLPFQAIECSLANIIPLNNVTSLTKNGVELLQDLLLDKVLTAKIYQSFVLTSHLEVIIETEDLGDLGTLLIENGCATERELNWAKAITSCPRKIFAG